MDLLLYLINKKANFFLSDLSKKAVRKAKKNLKIFKGNFSYKSGDCFNPWKGEVFDFYSYYHKLGCVYYDYCSCYDSDSNHDHYSYHYDLHRAPHLSGKYS